MKTHNIKINALLLLLSLMLGAFQTASAKVKIRLAAEYRQEVGKAGEIHIKAKAKREEGLEPAANVELNIYRMYMDSSILIQKIKTDKEGIAVFSLKDDKTNIIDTSGWYEYYIELEGNKEYSSADKSVSFKKCILKAELQNIDSINHIYVQLTDAVTGEPLVEEGVIIGVERLFNQLPLDEMQYTDEDGTILLPYEDNIPSIDKSLIFRITLAESETYGTVIARINTDLGVQAEKESTFHERTMWSPPGKTPWFLLIFPNLIIAFIWFMIFRLIYTLYKISTLKNN